MAISGRSHRVLFRLFFLLLVASVPIMPSSAEQAEIPPAEYEALVALYNATDGPNWANTWALPTDYPCSLYGITCTGGSVSAADLGWNSLSGTIPPELGGLANLTSLDLSFNQLEGAVPPELGNLASLENLSLAYNQLSGAIPPELGNLASLRWLSLNTNELSGAIPAQLGNLNQLESLNLYTNQLSGAIPPELGSLTSLKSFWIDYNQLSGTIPPELSGLDELLQLSFSYNQLSGMIPPEMGDLASLREIHLDHNRLSGTIPPQLGNLASLASLDLNDNRLSGSIPAQLDSLSNLQRMYLGRNELNGPVPPEIVALVGLTQLDLGYNRLWTDDAAVKAFLDAKDPDWAATQDAAAGPITPEVGGQVALPDPDGGDVTVVASAGIVTQTVTLAIMPLAPLSSRPDSLRLCGRAFSLGAYRESSLLEGFAFGAPVTVTLTYADAQADDLDEDTLTLYVRQDDAWVDAADTCAPASAYVREPEANRLTVAICHLSEFGLFGEGDFSYYMPVLRRK